MTVGRSTPLHSAPALTPAELLTPAAPGHPWSGRQFKAAWSSTAQLDATLVAPELFADVSADVACDPHAGRRGRADLVRHLVREPAFRQPWLRTLVGELRGA